MVVAPFQPCPPTQPDHPGHMILIIEANPTIREMLQWSLRLYGYRSMALLPKQSMPLHWRTTLACDPPSLILLDVAYAQETAVILSHVSQQWQSMFTCTLPPIVLLTTAVHRQRSLEQQTGYPVLPKPFHILELRRVIERNVPTQHVPAITQDFRVL